MILSEALLDDLVELHAPVEELVRRCNRANKLVMAILSDMAVFGQEL